MAVPAPDAPPAAPPAAPPVDGPPEPPPDGPPASAARRIARNVGALAVARGATLLLTLGTVAHVTRALGAEGYGVIGFGLALHAFFALVARPGLDVLAVRELARDPARVRGLAADVTSLQVALALGAAVAYAAVVWGLGRPGPERLALWAIGLPLLVQPFALDWVYQGVERMGVLAVRNVAASALQLAAALALVRSPEDLVWAAALQGLALAVVSVALWVAFRRDFGPLRLRVDWAAWGALLRPALPIAASTLMILVYYNLDKLMLSGLRGDRVVGLYEAAYRWVLVALVPATVFVQAFFPSLSAAHGDRGRMAAQAGAFARVNLGVGLPVALGGALLAGPLVTLLAGPEFAPAGPVLAVLMANVAVVYLNLALGQPLLAWDLQTPYFWAVGAGAAANVVLNVALIPPFGAMGAAWATLGAEAAVLAVLAAVYGRTLGTLPVGPAALAGAVAVVGVGVPVGASLALGWPWGVGAALAVPAFAAAAWGLGLVRPSDLAAVRGR